MFCFILLYLKIVIFENSEKMKKSPNSKMQHRAIKNHTYGPEIIKVAHTLAIPSGHLLSGDWHTLPRVFDRFQFYRTH